MWWQLLPTHAHCSNHKIDTTVTNSPFGSFVTQQNFANARKGDASLRIDLSESTASSMFTSKVGYHKTFHPWRLKRSLAATVLVIVKSMLLYIVMIWEINRIFGLRLWKGILKSLLTDCYWRRHIGRLTYISRHRGQEGAREIPGVLCLFN